ncbi:ankyrin repeat domain-containing protein [Legionella spiritensis]|uniref:Uncharacterized protein n=1 Tax=Legionella spiritensis TaxID=452 RepID=A0A0W0Z032_LEGSP|nr:ankyrin repeat domain-containing protein [Legionella spiritensis]KTD62239.1 hypothetical protein Lspi_2089 [Legionella spiritensis]SNV29029.1 Uncharacterised protein [Legionella spiritensis]
MSDIIVNIDENQGGFGDILFASKLIDEIKKNLLKEGKLVGNVYLTSFGQNNTFLRAMRNSGIDLEFGFNFIPTGQLNKLIESGDINPAVIIEAPTPSFGTVKCPSDQVQILSAREYSYGPYETVKLGNSYNHAESGKKEEYEVALTQDEKKRLSSYKTTEKKAVVRTGLIEELNEQGILLTSELVDLARLEQTGNQKKLTEQKEFFLQALPKKIRHTILQDQQNLSEYEENTELTFGYSHKSNRDFLHIHSGYIQSSEKNQDVFIASGQNSETLKEHLEEVIETLKEQGFSKIVYVDYDNDQEETLYDNEQPGKVYRLIHSKGIPHPQVVALNAISGPLTLASGDQSFGEAISSNKMLCYETYPHKLLLYSSYKERAEGLTEETGHALQQMSLLPDTGVKSQRREAQSLHALGVTLRTNPAIRQDITGINSSIAHNNSLAAHFINHIKPELPPISNPVDLAIIENRFESDMLPSVQYPQQLFLAIRYGNESAVKAMLKANPDALTAKDSLNNSAFIIAAQHNQYSMLKMLITAADKQDMEFSKINSPNQQFTMCHYLSPIIQNNPGIIADIFGSYQKDVAARLAIIHPKPIQKAPVQPVSVSNVGMFAQKKPEPVSAWEELEKSLQTFEDETLVMSALVVAREYLKAQQPRFESQYELVCRDCENDLELPANWVYSHVEEFQQMIGTVREHIEKTPELRQAIGTDWLPEPPPFLSERISETIFNDILQMEEEEEMKQALKPYAIVLREAFKDHPEEYGSYDEIVDMCEQELNVEKDWVTQHKSEFQEMVKIVQEGLASKQKLTPYNLDRVDQLQSGPQVTYD